jgi:hypothetical protein
VRDRVDHAGVKLCRRGEMKIFVGFGYNDRDSWVPDFVFPLIRAFGCEVVTGEDMPAEVISDEVRRRVESADALIAFRTRCGDPDATASCERTAGSRTSSRTRWGRVCRSWRFARKASTIRRRPVGYQN